MRQRKKEYLSSYLLQETKINRLRKMADLNPEMQLEYADALNNALLLRMKIERQISEVDESILSEVLFQKYIFGKTLEDIGEVLNYSTRHIERLHVKALDKFKM